MIDIKGVWKVYKIGDVKVEALKGVDLRIKKGEFVSIMGPSGSGKSTLLHIIGVLDTQTKGYVAINSRDVSRLNDNERTLFRLNNIGFVFQFYSLLPELNALENVYLTNMLLEKNNGESKRKAMEILELLGLKDREYNYPHQLSGGEQQRVATARALVNKPAMLLADEPTASLDSKTSKHVMSLFRKLNRELKQTVIMITHEEDLGREADRGIWLRDGEIVKEKDF